LIRVITGPAYSVASAGPVRQHDRVLSTFSDGVVLIRPLAVSDAEAHFAGEDDEMIRWLSGAPSTLESNRDFIADTLRMWAAGGPQFVFGVRWAATDELVGTIDARTREEELGPGQVNIAYGVYPPWRGRGIAVRAVALMMEFLRTLPDATQGVIRVDPANRRSAAVARAAGFRHSHRAGDNHDWYLCPTAGPATGETGRNPSVSCVFVCHDAAGRVLLARRGPGARDEPGAWDCGAGALEFGETFEEAVAREVGEEYAAAPLEISVLGVRNVLRADPPSHWVAVVFAVRLDPAAVAIGEPHKFDDLGWFAPDALPAPLHSQLAAALAMWAQRTGPDQSQRGAGRSAGTTASRGEYDITSSVAHVM
jgi:8-oxo-dGTP diphosphatase